MKFNKPKFWDYKKPNFLSYLLLPLTIPIIINNFFLSIKRNNTHPGIKKICVGNIYVGGTGKTPLVIKLYQLLKKLNFNSAVIKKFYNSHIDEQRILDQNTKLYCKKTRNLSLNEAIKDGKEIVIFDDGLQDRSISYDIELVCFNSFKWIGNGFLMPAGPLREKIKSISKYDLAFINGNQINNSKLKLLIKKYNKNIEIFESQYIATNTDQFEINEKYLIFSGIGTPESFKEILIKNKFNIVKEIIFPDHYNYTQKDINNIKLQAKKLNAKILTTEKDYIKIDTNNNHEIKFLKVELEIVNEKELLNYFKRCI